MSVKAAINADFAGVLEKEGKESETHLNNGIVKAESQEIHVKLEPGLTEKWNGVYPVNDDDEDTYRRLGFNSREPSLESSSSSQSVNSDDVKREVLYDCLTASYTCNMAENSGRAQVTGFVGDDIMDTIQHNFKEIDDMILGDPDGKNDLNVEAGRNSIEMLELKHNLNTSGKKDSPDVDLSDVLNSVDCYESSTVVNVKLEETGTDDNTVYEDYTSGSETEPFCDLSDEDCGDLADDNETTNKDQALLNKFDMSDCCVLLKEIDKLPYKPKIETFWTKHRLVKSDESESNKTENNDIPVKSEIENSLQCKVCKMAFKNFKSLLIHSKIHSKFNFMCCICGPLHSYDTYRGLEKHMTVHSKALTKCTVCGKILPNEMKLKFHMKKHGIKPFVCSYCTKAFRDKHVCQSHERTHTNERPFKCDICKSAFTARHTLYNHYVSCHADRRFPCEICGKRFRRKDHMVAHLASHSDARNYKCPLCDKTYKSHGSLSLHKRSHTGQKVTCEICERSFRDPGDLKKHYNVVHSDERNYKCDSCGLAFKILSSLSAHIKHKHADKSLVKKIECSKCDSRFYYPSELKAHMRFHVDVKAYQCTQCNKAFKLKEWLDNHVSRVHERTGDMVKCTECDKTFTHKSGLQKHMKYHKFGKQYHCMFCSSSYMSNGHLKRHIDSAHLNIKYRYSCEVCGAEVASLSEHMKTHNDEKPFPCEKCGRQFREERMLKLHLRVHWDTKPYQCKICDIEFTRKGNWQTHMKRIHEKHVTEEYSDTE